MQKIKRNAPKAQGEKERRKWNFADMRVTDVIDVMEKADWSESRRAAHNYGDSKNPRWHFTCQWLKKENFGRIRRVG